jgi:nucleoid-associated protein YgaU
MKYDFVIKETKSKGKELWLPVSPSEVTVKTGKGLETVNLLKSGEYAYGIGATLKEISFSSFFPKHYDSTYCNYADIPEPEEAIKLIEAWAENNDPIRLIVTKLINDVFLITSFEYKLVGGTPGDIEYTITFKKYKEIAVKEIKKVSTTNISSTATRTTKRETPKTYTVKAGDTLSKIALSVYGDSTKWKAIYEANKKVIGSDPNKLKVGTVLKLP